MRKVLRGLEDFLHFILYVGAATALKEAIELDAEQTSLRILLLMIVVVLFIIYILTKPLFEQALNFSFIRKRIVPKHILNVERMWVSHEQTADLTSTLRFSIVKVFWHIPMEGEPEVNFYGRAYVASHHDSVPRQQATFWSKRSYHLEDEIGHDERLHVRFVYEGKYDESQPGRSQGVSLGTSDYYFSDLDSSPKFSGRFFNEFSEDASKRDSVRQILGFPLYEDTQEIPASDNFDRMAVTGLNRLRVRLNRELFIGRGLSRPLANAWFQTFVSYSDEKVKTETALKMLFTALIAEYPSFWEQVDPNTIMDVGCADALLTRSVLGTLPNRLKGSFQIDLFDTDSSSLNKAVATLRRDGFISVYQHVRNIFLSTRQFSRNYGCIICANVAYYAPVVEPFIAWILDKLSENSFAILIHEEPMEYHSELKSILFPGYETRVPEVIRNVAEEVGCLTFECAIEAHLTPPSVSDEFWTDIMQDKLPLIADDASSDEHTMLLILEFLCQQRLDEIDIDTRSRVVDILHQELTKVPVGVFPLKSVIQFVIPKHGNTQIRNSMRKISGKSGFHPVGSKNGRPSSRSHQAT